MTYEATKKNVETLIGVNEGLISETLIDLYSKQGLVAEPAGAASVAALEVLREYIKGKTICCVISGGNNDINRMPEMEERALIYDGIKHYFIVNFPQRPGALREFVNDILGPNDDITRFEYIKRASKGTGPVLIGVALADKHDYAGLINRIEQFDPSFINLNGMKPSITCWYDGFFNKESLKKVIKYKGESGNDLDFSIGYSSSWSYCIH